MMTKKLRLISANTQTLTKLGKALFYCYVALAFLGLVGLMFGCCAIIHKFIFINSIFQTSWTEAILLIITAVLAIKIFYREALALVRNDQQEPIDTESEVTSDKPLVSNVIPFTKKSSW